MRLKAFLFNTAMVGSLGCLLFCSSGNGTPDGGSDGSASDVKPDKVVSSQDSGDAATCGSGLACEVCDNGYSPVEMAPAYVYPNLCVSADIAAFVTACGGNGSQTDCDNWQNAEGNSAPTCLNCVYSSLTDANWGLFACDNNGNCILNTGGCVDYVTGTVSKEKQAGGSGSCGDLIDEDNGCQNYACDNCYNDPNPNDYDTCLESAVANECVAYDGPVTNATGLCALLAADAANAAAVNVCFANSDTDLGTMATLLCGSTIADAGTD